jgi:hypothetical protein
MLFLMELIDQYEDSLSQERTEQIKRDFETTKTEEIQPRHEESLDDTAVDTSRDVDTYSEPGSAVESVDDRSTRDAELRSMGILKKRQYAPQAEASYEDERGAPRPRLAYSTPEPERPLQPEPRYSNEEGEVPDTSTANLFVEDRSGLEPKHGPPRTEDAVAKAKSDVYQELLMLLFRDREKVVRAVQAIVWDLSVKAETISLSPTFSVSLLLICSRCMGLLTFLLCLMPFRSVVPQRSKAMALSAVY